MERWSEQPAILNTCVRARRVGETLYEVADRLLTYEAIERTHRQMDAAKLLGITPRVMCYKARNYRLRRKDAKLRREVADETKSNIP